MSSTAPAGTQAVDRAAALIDLVVRADEPLSFTELSDETGLARSTTSRLLAALERTELVERDAGGGYVAGPLFALHAARARPVAADRPDRPAGARDRRRADRRDRPPRGRPRRRRRAHRAGRVDLPARPRATGTRSTYPPHCSSLGKVLYAFGCLPLPTGRLERRTERTVATRDALAAELARHPPAALRHHRRRARDRAHRDRGPRRGPGRRRSPRSASPGPPPGSRTGSTTSVGSSSSRPTPCRRCSVAGPRRRRLANATEGGRGMTLHRRRSCSGCTTRRWSATHPRSST